MLCVFLQACKVEALKFVYRTWSFGRNFSEQERKGLSFVLVKREAVRQVLFRVHVPGETWLIVNWWTREAKREESIGRSFAGDDMLIAVSLVCG